MSQSLLFVSIKFDQFRYKQYKCGLYNIVVRLHQFVSIEIVELDVLKLKKDT